MKRLMGERHRGREVVYNVGNRDWVTVGEIARIVIEEMGMGDVKLMLLDITRITQETAGSLV